MGAYLSMGVYLKKPITDKISTDEEDDKIKFGASSMQGWRETQEDAHNSIINFDDNTYFFAVYDGHGGQEVALYCAQNLPQFVKNTEAYKRSDLTNALIDGFLGFDATLTSEEVIPELQKLIENSKDDNDVSDEENVNELYEEASMPLDAVMEKYALPPKARALLKGEKLPLSPFLKARKGKCSVEVEKENESDDCENIDVNSAGSSSSSKQKNELGKENEDSSKGDANEAQSSSSKCTETVNSKENANTSAPVSSKDDSTTIQDSKETNKKDEIENNQANTNCNDENTKIKGDAKESKSDQPIDSKDSSIASAKPQENGKIKKGKVLAKTKGVVSVVKNKKVTPKRTAKQLYLGFMGSESESESEDEEDKTFQGPVEESSSDDEIEKADDAIEESDESSEDVEEEDLEDESDEEIDEDEHEDAELPGEDVPGAGSGCTAVVAIMRGTELYVANAGDSRCIVCRNGKAIDLSKDHKPESRRELERIKKAGGWVSDGRVKGGLNLSRAIGDHSYKLNKDLPAKEQMITALPDIQTYTVTPADEFMVLACDGIWNFMSSQEVADFVKKRLEKQPEKVSQVCEELFDNCLASNTLGDGTGCDNMTAIIVNFKNALKRTASGEHEEASNPKRAKTDDENIVQ